MTDRILEKNQQKNKMNSIDTEQLEYTAEKIFTYSTISVAVIAVYAAVIYVFVQQLKK
jgi:hypothetical protein